MNERYEWAVLSVGRIVHMSVTFKQAKQWTDMRKGIYKLRKLRDSDFESTVPIGGTMRVKYTFITNIPDEEITESNDVVFQGYMAIKRDYDDADQ